jgi:hypothetical protein
MGHWGGEERNTYRVLVMNPEGKRPPLNIGTDEGIMLKFI